MAHLAPAFTGDVSVGVSLPLKQLYVCSWCGCNAEERKKGEKKKKAFVTLHCCLSKSKGSATVLHTAITTSQPSPAVLSACVILCLANAFSGCSSISWRKGPVIIRTEVLPCSGWVLVQCSSIPLAARQADLLCPIAFPRVKPNLPVPPSQRHTFLAILISPWPARCRALPGAQSWGRAVQLPSAPNIFFLFFFTP